MYQQEMTDGPQQCRNWCFTLNNPTPADIQQLRSATTPPFKYLIFGEEEGESGTPHLQGFAIFCRSVRRSSAQATINPRAHLERMRGTSKQAADYCRKDDLQAFELGECPGPVGETTRRDRLGPLIEIGKTQGLRAMLESDPTTWARNYKGITAALHVLRDPGPRTSPPDVYWLVGGTGVGKTRAAVAFTPDSFYMKPAGKWWDGYDFEKTIIVDDYRLGYFGESFSYLLQLLDRYPMRVEYKGGSINLNSPTIIFTSAFTPSEVHSTDNEDIAQLLRRITKVIEVKKNVNVIFNDVICMDLNE